MSGATLASLAAEGAVASVGMTPNVVIILADDLGWGDVTSLNPQSAMPTPRIDSIATEGMRFTDAHSPSSVCTPTRYGLLTGRYAWRTWLKKENLGAYDEPLITPDRATLGTLLQAHGYRTGAVGKWHLGLNFPKLPEEETTNINWGIDFADGEITGGPVDLGFDEFFGVGSNYGWGPYVHIRDNRFTAVPFMVQRSIPSLRIRSGPMAHDYEFRKVLDRLTEEAVAFIERSAETDRPFFLYFPLTAPHVPLLAVDRFRGTTGLGRHGDFVAHVDWAVGEVLDAVREAGARGNTLVVFASDNGSLFKTIPNPSTEDHIQNPSTRRYRESTHRSNGHWSRGKGSILEGGHRVQLFVRWPEVVDASSVNNNPVSITDFFATLADIMGESLGPGVAPDSESLLPMLRGKSTGRRIPIVHHSSHGMFAIRDGRWKLVFGDGRSGKRGNGGGEPFQRPWQLYNLSADPGETTNLIEEHPQVASRLEASLEAIRSRADQSPPVSDQADLSGLTLSGVDFGTFDPAEATYTAVAGNNIAATTVTATPRHASAAVAVADLSGRTDGTSRTVNLAEGANPVTVTVTPSDGTATRTYTVWVNRNLGATGTPEVATEDLEVSVSPSAISEGQTATLTVAISNEVTFPEEQTFTLALSGTASAADYTGVPTTLTLPAGASSVTATLAASEDQEEEAAETVTERASLGGAAIGSATPTITSGSHDATLSVLSLAGTSFESFSSESSTYTASVEHAVVSTTVTATPADPASGVVITDPNGSSTGVRRTVSLAEGPNLIAITVTAPDGQTELTYVVIVHRATDPGSQPRLRSVRFEPDELWRPVAVLRSREGHGRAFATGGYYNLIWDLDHGGSPRVGGVDVFDLSDPRNPTKVITHNNSDTWRLREAHGLGLWNRDGQIVLAAQSHQGVVFFDVTQIESEMPLLSEIDLPEIGPGDYTGSWWLSFQAPYVYVNGRSAGLYVVDASDPTAPRLVARYRSGSLGGRNSRTVSVLGNLLVTTNVLRVSTFDIGAPGALRVLDSQRTCTDTYSGLFVAGLTFGSSRDSRGEGRVCVDRILQDGSIESVGSAGAGAGSGNYGAYQDGYFVGGFSSKVVKFELEPLQQVGSGTSGRRSRDEGFAQIIGNLVFAGEDHGVGSALIPHQLEPDRYGPEVMWVHPADGVTDQPVTTRVGVSMSDQVGVESLTSSSFLVRPAWGKAVPGQLSVNDNNVNFFPDSPLDAGVRYEVMICGLADLVGNAGGCFESSFATAQDPGAGSDPPTCDLGRPDPSEVGVVQHVPAEIRNGPVASYTWEFSDGTVTGPVSVSEVVHRYDAPGRHPILLRVSNPHGSSTCSAVQIVHRELTERSPSSSSTIQATETNNYVVNPDNDSVTSIGGDGRKNWEATVGDDPRTLAIAPNGQIWVANQGSGTISILTASGDLHETINLGYGADPYAVVFAPDGLNAYAALTGSGRLLKLDADGGQVGMIRLPSPRGIAVTADSQSVLVTRFVSDYAASGASGEVYVVDADTFRVRHTVPLALDPGPDAEDRGRGLPNYLAQVRISPDGLTAWVPSKKDNIARGRYLDGQDLTFESTTRAIASQIDLGVPAENLSHRIDFDDRSLPQALAFTPHGDVIAVALQGSNIVEFRDANDLTMLSEISVGRAPDGLAFRPDGTRLFVHNFLDRTVSVIDTSGLVDGRSNQPLLLTTVSLVGSEALPPAVLDGKRIFYSAADPRMSQDGYIACASCHLDGGSDRMVWDRTQFGEGLRNTIDLRGRQGTNGGFVHWSSNFDEIQDFEHDIRDAFGGTGFMADSDFAAGTRDDPLGDPKAGLSEELDDLAAYVESLAETPDSPYRSATGALTAEGEAGRLVFVNRRCFSCHGGQDFTDDLRHDVGTRRASSGGGLEPGVNTPTLMGLWLGAPFLHDGRHETLTAVLADPAHIGEPLTEIEKADLAAYLLQIDDSESGYGDVAARVSVEHAAPSGQIREGEPAVFTVTRNGPATVPLTVALSVEETGSMAAGAPPASASFEAGETSRTLSVPTEDDSVAEAASTITVTLSEGDDYAVGAPTKASAVIEDNDLAVFRVSFEPSRIVEGASATLTVAVSNGVTFSEAQSVALATSGTAVASDYTGVPATLTLAAGESSVTATLAASVDQEEEEAETVAVAATHSGAAIGSATVTINSVSHDATLSGLSLPGIEIGTLSSAVTSYQASVDHAVTTTTVTATATHSAAEVLIEPGSEVSLAVGANEIAITVTAEDGTTTQTYTVTVTRDAEPELPVISIAAVASPVPEGEQVEFTLSRTGPATEELPVWVDVEVTHWTSDGSMEMRFKAGQSSVVGSVNSTDDTFVRDDNRYVWTLRAGEGHVVSSEAASAEVVVEETDEAEFALAVDPPEVAEGESATVRVEITNGVLFEHEQSIALDFSGSTATKGEDYAVSSETLSLPPGASSATTTVTALVDAGTEDAEAVSIAARHAGETLGTSTLTILSVSRDATLSGLSLSGIDIGTFSSAVTSYTASVDNAVETTTVTAAASHAGAELSIAPGPEVSLAEGENTIAITVTAEDGTTRQTYTVTVTRAAPPELPVISIIALASPLSEGEPAEFRVSRTGPTTEALTVRIRTRSSNTSTVGSLPISLRAGQRSQVGTARVHDNTVVRDDIRVTWALEEGAGYAVSETAGSAVVVLEENDVAEFAVSAQPAQVTEGGSATVRVEITNGVTFARDQAIALGFAGSAAERNTDYVVSAESLTLRRGASSATAPVTVTALVDAGAEDAETVALAASVGGEVVGRATLTIAANAASPLRAQFLWLPRTHDGATAFRFELRFSEEIAISYVTLRDSAFEVTGGAIQGARRLARPSNRRWEITVEPASEADVVLALPVTTDCAADGAVCTGGGEPLSRRLEATVEGPGAESSAEGFPLAPANSSPSGIWSDGKTAWVADLEDARLYAYRRADGEREPGKDIATGPAPMGVWSDGETLWVAGLGGGLEAHRLADGSRQAGRDLPLEANAAPAGVWSDGETAWISEWLGDTVHAYRLSDGERAAGRDIKLAGGNLLPVGVWSDGETLWVADWRERVYAYRLTDGGREPGRDILAGAADEDPSGLWAGGGTLLSTSWEGGAVRAYRLPAAPPGGGLAGSAGGRAPSLPAIADAALRAAIEAALGKASGEAVSAEELAGLEALTARDGGIRDLAGLEGAAGLKELDLGFNPLADLRPLASLPALASLNLDGAAPDLLALASLPGLERLSLRHNGIGDLQPLAGLASLNELDVGANRVEDLRPLAGLTRLAVLRADRNRIADLWPLSSLAGLEALDLGANRVRDLQPLAGLASLRTLRLGGNGLAELHPLSGLDGLRELGLAGNAVEDLGALSDLAGLRRLDLRGNAAGDLRPLRALASLVWVHVGGSGIEDLAPLDGLDGLTVAGGDDRESPSVSGESGGRAGPQ